MIRLLIIGDEPGVRKGLQMRLAAETDLCVIGEAADCETALQQAILLCPDVVIIDCEMLKMDGIAMTSILHAACPAIRIILVSLHDTPQTRSQAMAAGASVFLAKSMPAETLLGAVRQGDC